MPRNASPFRPSILLACLALSLAEAQAGTLDDVTFDRYTPLSSNLELARRMLSPLTAAKLPQILTGKDAKLAEQPLDLRAERFAIYVPATPAPTQGYGLIVFVPPWDVAKVPERWKSTLDQYGFLFVTAARSGNETTALGRREPLALLAAINMQKRYAVDPARVYVAGFSGGSRIAMRLALAYPDVFRGAILNSGGDPIGDATVPLPPKDLFATFQSGSRLVYVSGNEDIFVVNAERASIHAMREWCQFHVEDRVIAGMAHGLIDASALSRALDALAAPMTNDTDKLAQCRAQIQSDVDAQLAQVRALIAQGRRDEARTLLTDIDAHFGGLAAPESVQLSSELK